jgi:hypothetical protein
LASSSLSAEFALPGCFVQQQSLPVSHPDKRQASEFLSLKDGADMPLACVSDKSPQRLNMVTQEVCPCFTGLAEGFFFFSLI